MTEEEKKYHYGGQAVIEGVMIRGRTARVTAVRRPNGEIATDVKPLALSSDELGAAHAVNPGRGHSYRSDGAGHTKPDAVCQYCHGRRGCANLQ